MTVRQDLHIRQGETWSYVFTKRDSAGAAVDLTGYTARAAIKRRIDGEATAYLSSGDDATGGLIELGGAAGTITLSMTAAQSAALATACGLALFGWRGHAEVSWPVSRLHPHRDQAAQLIYDLVLTGPDGVVTRELEGHVVVYREVTV